MTVRPTPRCVVFDVDGTLTDSKQPLTLRMASCLRDLLTLLPVGITTGGTWDLIQRQVLDRLEASEALLAGLHLLPACGTRAYDRVDGVWVQRYAHDLSPAQKDRITAALLTAAAELGVLVDDPWGDVVEDRGGQVTYSVLGQEAPAPARRAWDPDGSTREALRGLVQDRLPDLAVRTGRSTSVDVTSPGIDKAFGVQSLATTLGVPLRAVTYVGDRLGPGGNDEPVRRLSEVECVAVTGWPQTAAWVEALMGALAEPGAS